MPLTGNSLNWWIGLLSESSDFAFARAWQAPPIYAARDILSSIMAGELDLAGLSPARRQAIQGAASGLGFTEEALKPALFPSSAGRKPDLSRQFTAVPEVKPSSAIESLLTKVLRHSGLEAFGGKPKLQFSSPLEGVTLAEAFVGGERVLSEEFSLLPTGESQAELLMNRGLIWRGPSGDVEKVLANRFTAAAKQASQTQNPDIAAAFHRALYPRGERSVSPQWVSPRGDIPPALATRLAMTRLKPDWVEGAAQWPDWNAEIGGKLFAERDPSKRTAWHLASLAGAEGVAYSIRNYGATEDIGTRFSSEIIFSGMSGAGKYVKGAQRAGMQQYLLPSGVETFKGQMGHPVPDPWRNYEPTIQPASTYAMAKVGFMGGMPEGAGVINPSLGPYRVPAPFTKRIPLGTLDPSQVEILDQPQRVGRGKYIVANTPEGPFTVNQPQWDDVRFGDIGFGAKRGYPSLNIEMSLATSGSEGISWKGTGVKMFGALGDPRQVIPGEGELDIAAPWPSNPSATAEAWFQGLLHRGEAGRYGLADITTYTREAQARINQAFYAMAEQRMEMKWSPMPIAASVAPFYREADIPLRPHPEFEGKFQGQFPMLEFPEGLPITGLRKEWTGSRPTRVADRVMEYMFENMRPVAERLFASQAKTPYFNLFTAQMGGKVPDKQVVDLASLSSVDYARALGETEAGKEPTIEQHLAAIRSVTGGRFVRTAEGKLIPPTETAEYFWSRPQPGQPHLAGMRSYVGFFGSHFGSGAKAAGEALEGLTGQMEKTFSSPKFKRTLFSGFTPGGLYVPSTAWPSIELSEAAYMGTEDIMRLGSATGLSRRKILETSRAGELTSMVVRHPIPSKQLNLGNVLPVFPMGVGRAKGLPFESSRVPVLPVDVPVQGIGDVDADMYQFIQVARNYMNPDQRQKFQEFLSRMTGEESPDVARAGQEEYNQFKTWGKKLRERGSLSSALGELRKGLGIGSPITATQGDVQASFLEGMTGKQLMGTTYPWLLHQVGQVVPPEMEELFGVKAYTKALDATPFSEQLKSMFEINQTLNIVNKEGRMTGAMMNVLSPTTERAFGQRRFKAPGGTAPDWMGILSQVLGSGLIAPEIENQAMRLKALGLPENFQGDYFQAMETLGLRDPQSIQKYLATSPWGRLALLNPAGRAVRNLIGQGDLSLWESPFFEPEMRALGYAGYAAGQWKDLMSKRTRLGSGQMGEYIGGAMATGGRGLMLQALMGQTGTGFLRGGLPPSFAAPWDKFVEPAMKAIYRYGIGGMAGVMGMFGNYPAKWLSHYLLGSGKPMTIPKAFNAEIAEGVAKRYETLREQDKGIGGYLGQHYLSRTLGSEYGSSEEVGWPGRSLSFVPKEWPEGSLYKIIGAGYASREKGNIEVRDLYDWKVGDATTAQAVPFGSIAARLPYLGGFFGNRGARDTLWPYLGGKPFMTYGSVPESLLREKLGLSSSEALASFANPASPEQEFPAFISYGEASVLEGLRQMHPAHAQALAGQVGRAPRYTPSGQSLPSFQAAWKDLVMDPEYARQVRLTALRASQAEAARTAAEPEALPEDPGMVNVNDLPKLFNMVQGRSVMMPAWQSQFKERYGSTDPVFQSYIRAARGQEGYLEPLGGMGGEMLGRLPKEIVGSLRRAAQAGMGQGTALSHQMGIPENLLAGLRFASPGVKEEALPYMAQMAYGQFEPLQATSDKLAASIRRVDEAMQGLTGTSEATREGIDAALAGYTGGKKGPLMNELRTAVGMRNLAARLDAGEIGPAEYALGEAGLMQEQAKEQSRFQKFAKGGQIMTGLQWFYLSRMWGAFTEPVMQAAFTGAQATMGAYGAGLEASVPMGGLDSPMMRAVGAQAMGQYRLGQAGQAAWGPVLEMVYGAKGRNAEAIGILGPMAGMALTGGVIGGVLGGPAAPWAAAAGMGVGALVGAVSGAWGMAETWKSDTAYRELKRYRQAEKYASMAGDRIGPGVWSGQALLQYGISGPSAEEIAETKRGGLIEQAGVGLSYQDLMALEPWERVQAVGENIANLQERYKVDEPTARRMAQWSMTEQRSDLAYGDIYAQQARLGIDRTQLQFGLAQALRVPFRPGTAGFDRLLGISDQVKTSADLLRLQPAVAAAGGLYEPLAMAGRLEMLDFGNRIAGPPDERRYQPGPIERITESPFGLSILQMQARAYQEAVLSGRKPEPIWPTQRLTGAGAPEYAEQVKKYSFGAQYVEPYARTIDRAYLAAGQESQYAALYERGKTMTVDQMTVQQLNVQQVQGQAAQLGAQFGGGTARALLNQAQFGTPAQALALAQAAGTTLGVMGVGERLGINQGTMAEALRPFVSPAGGMQNFPGMLMSRVLSGGLQGDQADSALKFYNQAFFGGKTQYNQDVRLPGGASVPMGLDAFTMQWTVQQPQLQSRIEALQKDLTATGLYGLDTGERFVVESQIGSLQAMRGAPALSMRGGGESAQAYRQRVLNLMFNTGIGMENVQGLDPNLPLFGQSLAGQSFWSLDKKQRDRAYAQGQYQFQYQERQQAMSLSQFNQNWDLNRRQLDMNRRYQLEDFAFQDQMTALQRGFTRQQWGFQDRGTAMQRGFTQQQWGWQDEDIALQQTYRQQDRAWQLEERGQLNLGRGFQLETRLAQRAFSDETRGMQRRWQLEERGFEDADRGRHRLWQTEDLDEAIRFSTGRERKSLLRQRSRMNEDINAEDAGIGRARKQQDEMFKKEEAHLKKMRDLEDELWDLEKENYSRRFEREDELFQREELRFTTQTERDQATRAYQEEVWLLEDERNAATKAYQEEVWALEDARNEAMKARAEEQYNLAIERMDMEKAQFMERWGLQNEYNQKQLEFFEAQHEEQEIATQLQHTYFLLSQEGLSKLIASALDFKDAADLVRSAVTELLTAMGSAEWVGGGGGTPNMEALKGRADMGGNVWFGGVLGNISSGSFVPETKQTGYHGWAMPGDYMVLGGRKHTLAEQGPEKLDVLPAHSRLFSPSGKGTGNLAGALDGMKLYVVIDGKQFNAHMKARDRDGLYLEARR